MNRSIKRKTSITLSGEVLAQVDRLAGSKHSRSAIIEGALREFLRERERARIYARDLKILNANAEALNAEAEDTLSYQADIWGSEFE